MKATQLILAGSAGAVLYFYAYAARTGLTLDEAMGQWLGEQFDEETEGEEEDVESEEQSSIWNAIQQLAKILAIDVAVSTALSKGTSKLAKQYQKAKEAKQIVKVTENLDKIPKPEAPIGKVAENLNLVEKADDASKLVSKVDDVADASKLVTKVDDVAKVVTKADDAAKAAIALKSANVAAKSSKITGLLKKMVGGPGQIVSFIISQILVATLNLDPENFVDCESGEFDYNKLPLEAKVAIGAVPFLGDVMDLIGDKLCMSDRCPGGTQKINGLCYPPCQSGFASDGATQCYKQYPDWESRGTAAERAFHTVTSINKAKKSVGRTPDKRGCAYNQRDDGTSCWDDLKCESKCDNRWSWADGGYCHTKCTGSGKITKSLFDRQYCNANENKIGAVCYPKETSEWAMPTLGVMSQRCPAGSKDFGAGCIREAYNRGTGVIPIGNVRMKPRKGAYTTNPSFNVANFPFWTAKELFQMNQPASGGVKPTETPLYASPEQFELTTNPPLREGDSILNQEVTEKPNGNHYTTTVQQSDGTTVTYMAFQAKPPPQIPIPEKAIDPVDAYVGASAAAQKAMLNQIWIEKVMTGAMTQQEYTAIEARLGMTAPQPQGAKIGL